MNVSGLPDNVRRNVRFAASMAGPLLGGPNGVGLTGPGGPGRVSQPLTMSQAAAHAARLTSNRGMKRSLAVVQEGIEGTAEDVLSDYLCPICLELIKEAHIISCGHTFCHDCLKKSIETNKRCPKCSYTVFNMDSIFPNHLVNKQVLKYKKGLEMKETTARKHKMAALCELKDYIEQGGSPIAVDELNSMITWLQEKKDQLLCETDESKYKLLHTFLDELKRRKELELETVSRELGLVSQDLDSVKSCLELMKTEVKEESIEPEEDIAVPNNSNISVNDVDGGDIPGPSGSAADPSEDQNSIEGFNVPVNDDPSGNKTPFAAKKKKLHRHFEELADSYFVHRVPVLSDFPEQQQQAQPYIDPNLSDFGNCVCKFSQFSSMRPLATIDYAGDKFPASSNIASSIEFDKDGEFFAVAGLTKKIRIFDYANVIRDVVDIHYPCSEMLCESKISCVSWSSYLKNKLASSDYDGDVTLWDAFTTQKLHVYKEHQKRCWSVDFNKMDTKLLASGSDDTFVKLWHLDSERSLTKLEAKTNVCCVQFNPESRYHLAFGSADHSVHYYDLRNMKEALRLFRGHRKAVSYVKFISGEEIVSASTDSELKVWNVNQPNCVQSLRGHINDKNFVGLATDGEYVACGSENNSLCVYYKGLPNKILSFRFDQRRFILDPEYREDVPTDFVSAVCWRKGSNVLVTGNSQGIIKVLQMV